MRWSSSSSAQMFSSALAALCVTIALIALPQASLALPVGRAPGSSLSPRSTLPSLLADADAATLARRQGANGNGTAAAATTNYAGYLVVHFYDTDPKGRDGEQVYAHVSVGNNAVALRALNNDDPILTNPLGEKAARDPFLVTGNGKAYVIATNFNAKARGGFAGGNVNGSRQLVVWESTRGLTNFGAASLVEVMPKSTNAGNVWAPEAVFIPNEGRFMVTWSSYTYNNPQQTGAPNPSRIFYAYTTDFKTFTPPQVYMSVPGRPIIDMDLKQVSGNTWVRFFKLNDAERVIAQISNTGIFGSWSAIGSGTSYVDNIVSEAPQVFRDNVDTSLWHVWVDTYGSGGAGNIPYKTKNIAAPGYQRDDTSRFPGTIKHVGVLPITQAQLDEVTAKWG